MSHYVAQAGFKFIFLLQSLREWWNKSMFHCAPVSMNNVIVVINDIIRVLYLEI